MIGNGELKLIAKGSHFAEDGNLLVKYDDYVALAGKFNSQCIVQQKH